MDSELATGLRQSPGDPTSAPERAASPVAQSPQAPAVAPEVAAAPETLAPPGAFAGGEAEPSLSDPGLYLNRELSWLDFNDRVLQLAEDPHVPLLERVKFCAIYTTDL